MDGWLGADVGVADYDHGDDYDCGDGNGDADG